MKSLLAAAAIILPLACAGARVPPPPYTSCDLAAQHRLKGQIGGINRDAGQAHISFRANILEADLGTARTAGRLTQTETDRLFRRVERVRRATDAAVGRYGALAPVRRAGFDRDLDAVARRICRA